MSISKKSEMMMILEDSFVFYLGMAASALFLVAGLYMAFGIFIPNILPPQTSDSSSPVCVAPFFIVIPAIIIFAIKRTKISLDKSRGMMSVERSSLFVGGGRLDYELSKIAKVQFRQSPGNSNSSDISFMLSDGSVLSFINMTNEVGEANLVAQFLGVPFEAKGPPTFAQAADMAKQTAEYWGQKGAEQKKMDEMMKGKK